MEWNRRSDALDLELVESAARTRNRLFAILTVHDELGDERIDVVLRRLDDEVAPGEEPPREITITRR